MIVVSGVKNPPPYPQDFRLFSVLFSRLGYPIIETWLEIPRDVSILIETNPSQIIRNRFFWYFPFSAYVGFEPPNGVITNVYILDEISAPQTSKVKLHGKRKCYLGRPQELYVKDGHAIMFITQFSVIEAEVIAYVRRWDNVIATYYDKFPFQFVEEQCETIIPSNPYAKTILKMMSIIENHGVSLQDVVEKIKKASELFKNVNRTSWTENQSPIQYV